jgi:putative toxin-antitoxin system antitoxin component (TIGR02293 family)
MKGINKICALYGVKRADLKHIVESEENINAEKMYAMFDFALDYFGSDESTQQWFTTRNLGLGGVTPLSLLHYDYGFQRVENTIIRLAHGMTA